MLAAPKISPLDNKSKVRFTEHVKMCSEWDFGNLSNGANTSKLTSANLSKLCCMIYLNPSNSFLCLKDRLLQTLIHIARYWWGKKQ